MILTGRGVSLIVCEMNAGIFLLGVYIRALSGRYFGEYIAKNLKHKPYLFIKQFYM